jgi:glutamine synthetase
MEDVNETRLELAQPERRAGCELGELDAFLTAHPGVKAIDLLIADLSGALRGKRVLARELPSVLEHGVRMAASLFALDITGQNVDATGLTAAEGEMDRICRPITGTLKPVPWAPQPTAQMLLAMHESDGTRFFADPWCVLRSVVDRFSQAGLTPVVAVELEFYLLDRNRNAGAPPVLPVSIRTGERFTDSVHCYSLDDVYHLEPYFNDIARVCELQGIPASTVVPEYAPAQFEINLGHVADPLLAVQHAICLKRAVKAVALEHGLNATFMALPLAGKTSSGTHIHVSIVDRDGRNLFDDGTEQGSGALRHAVGGLAATMAEAFLLFVPNANSFRRFGGLYAPLSPAWGYDNRTTGLRIPKGSPQARRVEHRVAGADANPILVLAAVLAGIWHGLEQRIEPTAPIVGNAFAQCKPTLPVTWDRAIAAFDQATIMPDYLGRDFCRVYSAVRKSERDRFNACVTPLEYEWYFQTV